MITEVTTQPTSEPVSLVEAKDHLRITSTDDDSDISSLIAVAREECEQFMRRSIMPQTVTGYLDRFATAIRLPFPPLLAVSSIAYIDTDGSTQTVNASVYAVNLPSSALYLAYGQSWPAVRDQKNAITITFQTGYADAASVPAKIKQAILLLVSEMYENREMTTLGVSVAKNLLTVESLLWPYRVLEW